MYMCRVHTAQQPIGRIALICNGRLNVERLNCWFAFRDFRISAHIRGFIREYRQLSVLFGDMSDVENSVHFGSLVFCLSCDFKGRDFALRDKGA